MNNKEYTNNDVYAFLAEECRCYPLLWKEYGDRISAEEGDASVWEALSERMDCFRVCDECGKPMIEGYVVDGCETYCSTECLNKHMSLDEFQAQYNQGEGDTYYTTWYEDSLIFNRQR